MAIQVHTISLWRREIDNRPGALANVLAPLADAGADLRVLMGYRYPAGDRGAIELYPVAGKKPVAAAQDAGLSAAAFPALFVEGDNRAGVAHSITRAIAEARINLTFLVALVIGKKYAAVLGFETEADARRAAGLVKKAKAPRTK